MSRHETRVSLSVRWNRVFGDARRLRGFAIASMATCAVLLLGTSRGQEPKEPVPPAASRTLGQIIDEASQGVVLISVETKSGEKIGIGSGFLINEKGWIATNLHVVRRAGKAEAQFQDGTKVAVKGIRAYDKKADLAILELERMPEKAKPMPLGPRKPPAQGDPVTAIGHPNGLKFSATNGIVSAVRNLPEAGDVPVPPENQHMFVQSDAAIAGGSSGGPLFSGDGRVVGINTFVLREGGTAFAIHVSHLLDLQDKAAARDTQPLPGDPASDFYDPLAEFVPRIREMYVEFENAAAEHQKALMQAGPVEIVRLQLNDPGPKYAERFVKIADRDRKSVTAFQALYVACMIDKKAALAPAAFQPKALNMIVEDFATEKWLISAIPGLSRVPHEAVSPFLRQVIEKSPHPDVQGTACFYLADHLRAAPKPEAEEEALALLKRCAGEFKQVRISLRSENQSVEYTLEEIVKPWIFEAENLLVGRQAPDIVANDVDGKTFKLSDYRGKIVVVDFFADWCPHCVKMYPEERALVATMADKPFALLGVNVDGADTLRQLIADKKVIWPCWSDGPGGPISETWQVPAYPRMYVLDQDGVIRHKFLGATKPGQLTTTVAKMVETLQAKTPQTKDKEADAMPEVPH